MSDKALGVNDFRPITGRGEQIIANIKKMQESEKQLMQQLNNESAKMRLNAQDKQKLINTIQALSDARQQMYFELKTNQDFYRSNVAVSHNILTQETDALEIVERELHRAKNRLNLLNDQRNSRLRLVEINRYYGSKYQHHTLILKYITLVFSLILVITYLYNNNILPGFLYTTLFVIVGSVGLYFIIKEIYDAYTRDSMYYQQYDWKKIKGVPPLGPEYDNADENAKNKDSLFGEKEQETCVGQECCDPEQTWVPSPFNRCYDNENLREPKLVARFGPTGYPKYTGTTAVAGSASGIPASTNAGLSHIRLDT
tara:strand:- start:2748 stop:3686 length:939 start_codon:yes stop_codon:yes gene_type:complete